MNTYKSPSFVSAETEITNALSSLQRHGLKISLPENLAKRYAANILFDGDDGLFKHLINDARVYFEYGCGKSTEWVYNNTFADIYAVDTSHDWTVKLESSLRGKGKDRLHISWVDVGEVEDWGMPISFEKRQHFKKYATCIWRNDKNPDLVLIDGRFRVLSFLTSLKYAPVGTKLLFDDYTDRLITFVKSLHKNLILAVGKHFLRLPPSPREKLPKTCFYLSKM